MAECEDCALPDDCARCERFRCRRCERDVPWTLGAADDTPGLCDECAEVVQADWGDEGIAQA